MVVDLGYREADRCSGDDPLSRTDRLFSLIDALRRRRRPVTAAVLAEELSVSERTIYRDIATLSGLGAPVEGEAGMGYVLRSGFFLPPLMFDEDEREALVLGARWVERQADSVLAKAATNAIAKIAMATPSDQREALAETGLWAALPQAEIDHTPVLKALREAIRREEKLFITYRDAAGAMTERTVWPIGMAFYDRKRLFSAWCELRTAFRHFHAENIGALSLTGERYPTRRAALVKAWRKEMRPAQTLARGS
ncbi:putative DNA-binding transcriptional regulator YafY [Methylobacterium brachythecii]|uniref:Putative DNA-binding transcriptional regulator YafY n=1 Tax=Methylobacterium brachythecii TaxID=1176177 RepID=A0A7W6F5T7_9HYPH|nr:YafY family protein [Methylobacterium brachythecii]MBB3901687.1 putative DNA-binding transcriptional regulator YafY [Methylobacterium brachythecii]